MKRTALLVLAALAAACVGCKKDSDTPKDPATFSLIGKKYVCESSTQNYDYLAEVLYFFSTDSMVYYPTEDKNFELDKAINSDYGRYELNYPNISVFFGKDERPFVLKDTATIYSSWWEQTFLLDF